jgi:hypothetical protein
MVAMRARLAPAALVVCAAVWAEQNTPSREEQREIISEIRKYAMNYSKSLPDFICTQVTRKYVGPTGREGLQLQDTVVERLTYFDEQERYKVTMVNGKAVDLSHEAVGRATSTGDFGTLLRETLWPKANALVGLDHSARLRGKLCYVFAYRISRENSDLSISFGRSTRMTVGYRGLIYVDKMNRKILRITLEATGIPRSFPVQATQDTLDYGYQNLGGQEFLLPLKAQVFMVHGRERNLNDIEFRRYNKYSADAKISFDVPAPLPDDQTKEQPAQP